ncbi:hypothetical protein [Morganella sp. EGD-HP17]|uniref:hypothetical protein n=1 Tax=Morganella sp. EGD-HP17 TaxID=1435146 RepID=UPI000411633E|nr:hypothetical protein [Morganella sp. EGD-HP17]ETO41454.1 hypothetical protein X965_07940 [Morganella sp. EGD-HP17]
MEHEINLGTAVDKAAQLSALLFQLSAHCIDPITDNLIELARELSDMVSGFLIEESINDNRDMSQEVAASRVQLIDTLLRVKAFTAAAQHLINDNEEHPLSLKLLCQAEAEIDEVLEGDENE